MVRTRTTKTGLFAEAIDGALAAFDAIGVRAGVLRLEATAGDSQADGVLEISVDDRVFEVSVEVVSYCTAEKAAHLLGRGVPTSNAVPLLVADRITAEARNLLTAAGWSWLDRRGRLHLRAPGVYIDQPVPAAARMTASTVGPAIRGRSGITIAYWLSAHPGESMSPNRHAAMLRLAPSTISTTVRRLAEAGLVDEYGGAVAPELFWELAAVWRTDRSWLLRRPEPKEHVPLDPLSPSWCVTGTAAAASYGAPVAAAGEGPLELYVTGPVEVSIATRRYGAATPGTGAAVVAVPPTSLVTDRHEEDMTPTVHGWPAAPLLTVALDLAQDAGRGREILEEWKDGDGIWR